MVTVRAVPRDVYRASLALQIVTDLEHRDEHTSAQDVAGRHGVSVARVYQLRSQAQSALLPKRSGPRPRSPEHGQEHGACTQCEALRQERDALQTKLTATIPWTPRVQRALELVLTVCNVSLGGIQEVYRVLTSGAEVPAKGLLQQRVHEAGVQAQKWLDGVLQPFHTTVTCLAGDDIFFHRTAVKVLLEPRSSAVVQVGRWPWRDGEDWALWLEPWKGLKLFLSDAASDLSAGAALRGVAHGLDLFHERRWWWEHVFAPLSAQETSLAKPPKAGHSTTQTPAQRRALRKQTEHLFYNLVAVEQVFLLLFDPLAPDDRSWSEARVQRVFEEVVRRLEACWTTPHSSLLARLRKHLHQTRGLWAGHVVLWDHIEIQWQPGSEGARERVLDAVLDLQRCQRRAEATGSVAERSELLQQAAALQEQLQGRVKNLEAIQRQIAQLLAYPRRSSSLVEAFNSRLRVLQMVHRNVSDPLLALVTMAWNLSHRKDGRRKGRSPFQMLGVELGSPERPWYDVLLDAMVA